MHKSLRHLASFAAQDQAGNVEWLDVFVEILDARSMGHYPNAEVAGFKQIRTKDGSAVNRLGRGKYQVLRSGQILTSNDPKAP